MRARVLCLSFFRKNISSRIVSGRSSLNAAFSNNLNNITIIILNQRQTMFG